MKLFTGIAMGFTLALWAVYVLDNRSYHSALASFTCGQFGLVNVFRYDTPEGGSYCARIIPGFTSDYAIDLIMGNFKERLPK